MKKLLTLSLIALCNILSAQTTVYEWEKKEDPKWTSSNPSDNTLDYHGTNNGNFTVSTSSHQDPYNNGQITTYTSDVMNLSYIRKLYVYTRLDVKLKDVNGDSAYDWLYFQYSTNGGVTWINPVAKNEYKNANNIPLTSCQLGTNNNYGWSGHMSGDERYTYVITNPTNNMIFRYVFVANSTINSGNGGGDVYYADIREFSLYYYNPLPIKWMDFQVEEGNRISWKTMTETNSDYFIIQRSNNGIEFTTIGKIKAAGISENIIHYEFMDLEFKSGINYYRFVEVDFDGKSQTSEIVSIDNEIASHTTIMAIYNLEGQIVTNDYDGVRIVVYPDGTIKKEIRVK